MVPGAKPIIYWGITACVNSGEEVIYPNPGFPIYESMINFVGGQPVPVPLREENEFRLDAEELRSLVTDKTRMIILNSPHNPTGGVLTLEDLQAIAASPSKNSGHPMNLTSHPVRGHALQHRRPPRDERAHHLD